MLLGKIYLFQLVELLAFAKLTLLLLEFLSHTDLTITGGYTLILFLLVGTQHGVLVQCCPFVNLILKAAHYAVRIKILVLLYDTKVLLQPLLKQGS